VLLIRAGFALLTIGLVIVEPIVPRATSGWYLVVPLLIAGSGSPGRLTLNGIGTLTRLPLAEPEPELSGQGQNPRPCLTALRLQRGPARSWISRQAPPGPVASPWQT
jgi:hypothetical protein